MADRLRAEAEEELTALRTAHKDTERELAAAQQRQKEAEMQLATVQGELKESKQRLTRLAQAQDKPEAQSSRQEPERSKREYSNSENREGTERGRGRGLYRLGGEGVEARSQNEAMRSVVGEDVRIECKGVTKRYLRNVTNEDRDGKDVRSGEARRTVTTERSR